MSRISIDSEGRIHIEDEPVLKPQEAAASPSLDTPAGASGSPGASNAVSREGARDDSSRLAMIFFATVAVLAAVLCAVYFGSNSGTGSSSSGVSSKTTSSTKSNGTQSKPSAQTLTAEDRVVEDYSKISDKTLDRDKEYAGQLMRNFGLPFTLNHLAACSPSELSEALSKLTEESTNPGYYRFTGRGKIRLYKDELTNPELVKRFDVPWYIEVNTKDKEGNLIFKCNLANIRSAARISDIVFIGYVPIENPTYGNICEHVAQVLDYERIGLRRENDSAIHGYAIANDVGPVYVAADVKPGYFRVYLSRELANNDVEYVNRRIKESPFQASR